ncbi:hypothetical protein BCR41DRAFT_151831 [Lobosporangium transversale]|uniref:Homeobox domain-containing protein n=1 Tax=Lobosporangium transversale TaxID=64571 RepID=A0A1Y2GY90_9FUNG|nr:hypothetical protein BCR41DRAFT_151831 [Lobosporangium transversale]ORZ27235.1 hypothetical protein BCR41DRAFT_151831 [Lobosporangium transversale]|eukprot:XP_021884962.1 hypothetical protein BCR41DRAFT_151831 [Lobosporangium transversale]
MKDHHHASTEFNSSQHEQKQQQQQMATDKGNANSNTTTNNSNSNNGTNTQTPQSEQPKKAKRKRITPEQLEDLVGLFEKTDTPSFEIRESLAKKLGMTNREIQV